MGARGGVRGFVLRRAGMLVLTLWGLATIVFLMIKAIPGDEARMAAGEDASAEQVELVRQRLGLDAALPVQYVRFLGRLVQGDLGQSTVTLQPVARDVLQVLPATLELVVFAMAINLALGLGAGILAAASRGSAFDGTTRVLAVVTGGLPVFWLALMLQYFVGSVLGILPISGQHAFGMAAPVRTGMPTLDAALAGNPAAFGDALRHMLLPAVALALLYASQVYRTVRASLLAVLASDFIPPVRAKGASPRRILLRHALPNGFGPVLTLAGTQIGTMVGAAVLVETVFARPGVGAYLANAVAQKDTFAVLGTVMFVGALVCVINLAVDLLELALDPRIRAAALSGDRR
jgi:dipeptide transport system permease protein